MGKWTHVCGCIRVDDLRVEETPEELKKKLAKIRKTLGKIVESRAEKTKLPCGSEGSIKYSIIVNPNINHLAAYVIPIWGDLRDLDNTEYVEKWFYDVCEKIGYVRNAVLNIDVEFGSQKNISYSTDDETI